MSKMAVANPAFKHIHTATRHAKMKGLKNSDLNGALMHYCLVRTYDLDDEDALLMARSIFAYAASLIVRRQQAAGLDTSGLDLGEMNRELDHPAFLAQEGNVNAR